MEITRELEELIAQQKIEDAFEFLKSSAPKDVADLIEKSLKNPNEMKKLEDEWKDLTLLLHLVNTSFACSKEADKEALVSCVLSSVNAIKIAMKYGMKKFVPILMRNAARALILMDEKERAERMYLEAEKICEELGDEEQLAAVENDLAALYYELKKYADAKVKIEEALEIRRKISREDEIAESLSNAAEIYVKLGDFESAESCFKEAEKLLRELIKKDKSQKFTLAILLSNFGMFCKKVGRFSDAKKMFKESLELLEELEKLDDEFSQFVATALRHLGDLMREIGDFKEAERYYKLSAEKFREIQSKWESRLAS